MRFVDVLKWCAAAYLLIASVAFAAGSLSRAPADCAGPLSKSQGH